MNHESYSNPVTSCKCIGPQNNEPLCPCAMRARTLMTVDGRWLKPLHAVDQSESYSDMMRRFAKQYKDFAT